MPGTASYPPGKEQIDTYHQYQGELTEWEQAVADSMMEAYNGTASQFQMVGRYQLEETLAPAVSVGIRITLKSGNGTKDYLFHRTGQSLRRFLRH